MQLEVGVALSTRFARESRRMGERMKRFYLRALASQSTVKHQSDARKRLAHYSPRSTRVRENLATTCERERRHRRICGQNFSNQPSQLQLRPSHPSVPISPIERAIHAPTANSLPRNQ